jgi:hypothetical protein
MFAIVGVVQILTITLPYECRRMYIMEAAKAHNWAVETQGKKYIVGRCKIASTMAFYKC